MNWMSSIRSTSHSRYWRLNASVVFDADGVDEVVEEVLGRDVEDPHLRVVVLDVVADRVEQVGLAEAGRPVDEQGVVGLARRLRNGLGRREGQAVRARRDERVEREARIEPRGVGLVGLRGGGADRDARRGDLHVDGRELVAVGGVGDRRARSPTWWPTTAVTVSSTSWRYRSWTRLRCRGFGAASTSLSPAKSTGRSAPSVRNQTFSETCSRKDSAHCAQSSSTSAT